MSDDYITRSKKISKAKYDLAIAMERIGGDHKLDWLEQVELLSQYMGTLINANIQQLGNAAKNLRKKE